MNTDRLGIELFPAKQKKTDEKKKTGKLTSMERMNYLSSDFPVYQLSEKSNFSRILVA